MFSGNYCRNSHVCDARRLLQVYIHYLPLASVTVAYVPQNLVVQRRLFRLCLRRRHAGRDLLAATRGSTRVTCSIVRRLAVGDFRGHRCYHLLYSHRAFRANLSIRIILAAMGSSAFQSSIKWWYVMPGVDSCTGLHSRLGALGIVSIIVLPTTPFTTREDLWRLLRGLPTAKFLDFLRTTV